MQKFTTFLDEAKKPTPDAAVSEITTFFRQGHGSDIRKEDPKFFGSKVLAAVSCRYWGKWVVPDGEEDDGDYDWEVLDTKSSKTLHDFIKGLPKKHKGLKFRASVDEKNWITIIIE